MIRKSIQAEIVPVLIAGLQDNVEEVQQDAIEATRRFQVIEPGLLEQLAPYLTGGSVQTAYGVGQMLSALGVMAAGENSELRQQIVRLLVAAIQDERSQRECQKRGNESIKLEDTFYEALLLVTGLPSWYADVPVDRIDPAYAAVCQ